jgi:hypothetical protein
MKTGTADHIREIKLLTALAQKDMDRFWDLALRRVGR